MKRYCERRKPRRARKRSRSSIDWSRAEVCLRGIYSLGSKQMCRLEPTFTFPPCELNRTKFTAGFMVLRRILPIPTSTTVRGCPRNPDILLQSTSGGHRTGSLNSVRKRHLNDTSRRRVPRQRLLTSSVTNNVRRRPKRCAQHAELNKNAANSIEMGPWHGRVNDIQWGHVDANAEVAVDDST